MRHKTQYFLIFLHDLDTTIVNTQISNYKQFLCIFMCHTIANIIYISSVIFSFSYLSTKTINN